jgi:hypothetical protein
VGASQSTDLTIVTQEAGTLLGERRLLGPAPSVTLSRAFPLGAGWGAGVGGARNWPGAAEGKDTGLKYETVRKASNEGWRTRILQAWERGASWCQEP